MTATRHEITWDELATIYDKHHSGRRARTLPMEDVMKWALGSGLFEVLPNDSLVVAEDGECSVCQKPGKPWEFDDSGRCANCAP